MSGIGIVSPGHPDEPGGVTDLTSRLVRHWTDAGHVVAIASDRTESPDHVVDRWSRDGVTAVLIQYVPFLYARRGVSRVPERLMNSARRHGIRTTLFVHEPWVPLTRPQWLVTGPLQRLQLRRLVRRANATVTTVPAWQDLLDPRPGVQYVSSTLGPAPAARADGALSSPVLFSPFGAGINWRWITAAADAIGSGLTVLGASESEGRRHPEVSQWIRPGWDWRGRLAANEILALLGRARLVLAPFVDGLTGRRTSAAAALSSGARLVSSTGPLFDPFFRSGPIDLAHTETEFAAMARSRWNTPDTAEDRASRIDWFNRNLDPRTLDQRLLEIVLGTRQPAS